MNDRQRAASVAKAFTDQVREEMKRRGLSVTELAWLVGRDRSNLSRTFRGNHPFSLKMALMYADALQMDVRLMLVPRATSPAPPIPPTSPGKPTTK
jgi:hypothetical protein